MRTRSNVPRKAEIARTIKGVIATGLNIERIEVEGSKFVIHTKDSTENQESPLEMWRRKNG